MELDVVEVETGNALAIPDRLESLIAEIKTPRDVRKAINYLDALAKIAVAVNEGTEAQNEIAFKRLEAIRLGGQMLSEVERGAPPGVPLTGFTELTPYQQALKEMGASRVTGVLWQKIGAVPKSTFEDYQDEQIEKTAEATMAGLLRFAGTPSIFSSESNEWYTPGEYIEAAREVMGGIDLDPASCEIANKKVKAAYFFTEKDNGLAQPWHGRVWLNPPYGKDEGESSAGMWGARLIDAYKKGEIEQGILLVNAVTDRKWFQAFWEYPICFTNHRIRFYKPTGDYGQPTFGNALIYAGLNVEAFATVFSRFGAVVRRIEAAT